VNIRLQSYSIIILVLYLAVAYVCCTAVLTENLYAQPSSFVVPDDKSPIEAEPIEAHSAVSDGEPNNADCGLPSLGDSARRFIDPVKEKLADPLANSEGFVEDTLGIINENSLLVPGLVAVVAVGAGVAAFSRHHHGRSRSSHSAQYQTQQDTEEE
jgi:hypothetical protein